MPPPDVLGRICVRKTDFEAVHGFDERISRYGFEDYDLVYRLEMNGLKRVIMGDPAFHQYIGHGDEERYDLAGDRLEGMYIYYKDPSRSEVLVLEKDGSFLRGTAVDYSTLNSSEPTFKKDLRHVRFAISIESNNHRGWTKGCWRRDLGGLIFEPAGMKSFRMIENATDKSLTEAHGQGLVFYPVRNTGLIHNMHKFNVLFAGRCIMKENLELGRILVNDGVFGRAVVYKNFDRRERLILS